MASKQEIELNRAYKALEKKVLSSDSYRKFITSVADLKEFREIFSYNGKFNDALAEESLKDLDNLRYICNNETRLKKEDEFHQMIINCVSNEDVITNIVNTFFMETKYGNPKREKLNDYTLNDRMFYILQSIFGIDTLTESINNKDVLFHKFNEVTMDYSGKEAEYFINLIDEIYKEASIIQDPEEMKNYISSKKQDLSKYILDGSKVQLREVTNSENGEFNKYNNLDKIISEIFDDSKKM